MAIIVVLAAVAIPTFGRHLETARETGDMQIIRSFYDDVYALAVLDASVDNTLDGKNGGTTFSEVAGLTYGKLKGDKDSTTSTKSAFCVELSSADSSVKFAQTSTKWEYVNNNILGVSVPAVSKDIKRISYHFETLSGGGVRLTNISVASSDS